MEMNLFDDDSLLDNQERHYKAAISSASAEESWTLLEDYSRLSETLAAADLNDDVSRQQVNGIYYTSFSLARSIVTNLLDVLDKPSPTFFEPCVGGGAFLFAYIDEAFERSNRSYEELRQIIENCFIADNDPKSIENLLSICPTYFEARYGFRLDFPETNVFLGDSLLEIQNDKVTIRNFKEMFGQPGGFDIIATNPPYKLMKKDKRRSATAERYIDHYTRLVRKTASFKYNSGTLNLYKLFTEAVLEKWSAKDGMIGLLIPRGLLSDLQSAPLRKRILESTELQKIYNLAEGNEHFKNVGQAFTALTTQKGRPTTIVPFAAPTGAGNILSDTMRIPLDFFQRLNVNLALFELSDSEMQFLNQLAKQSCIQEIPGLVNLRGELDMTLDAEYITTEDTGYPLIQGSGIKPFTAIPSGLFVKKSFLNRPKGLWIHQNRIACQQISNMNQANRLKWSLIPAGSVMANSCNFLALDSSCLSQLKEGDLYKLLGLLNSQVMNKRFKLLSANNHISNQEVASLPVGNLNSFEAKKVGKLASLQISKPSLEAISEIDKLVIKHFELDQKESL